MNIIVFGATGAVGSRVVKEAVSRGHNVTAISRSEQMGDGRVTHAMCDVADADAVTKIIQSGDVIVSAIRPKAGQEELLGILSQNILHAARAAGARLVMVGGAARLRLSEDSPYTVLTAPNFLPKDVVPIAQACQNQYEMVQREAYDGVSYISPPAMLVPGVRRGEYVIGDDVLVYDNEGNSTISMEDFAVAILDEAEKPQHTGQAFTVGYQ